MVGYVDVPATGGNFEITYEYPISGTQDVTSFSGEMEIDSWSFSS